MQAAKPAYNAAADLGESPAPGSVLSQCYTKCIIMYICMQYSVYTIHVCIYYVYTMYILCIYYVYTMYILVCGLDLLVSVYKATCVFIFPFYYLSVSLLITF